MKWARDTPWWVFAICFSLASIEPITHFCLQRIDNEEAVFSGLHTPDSAIYLTCMKMLDNDFFSPYATCTAPNGPNDPAFLPTPFHWLYAILGEIGRWFGIGEFMFLGIANGIFGFVYLLAVYRFMKTAVPELANLAFVLWSLGGGLGGVAFLLSMAADVQGSPSFETAYFRFFMYELIEGPGLFPVLHIPRLYYTASLAFGFGALTAIINGLRMGKRRLLLLAGLLLFCSAIINIRFGTFVWVVAIIYLVCQDNASRGHRAVLAEAMLVPVACAAYIFFWMQTSRSAFLETSLAIVRESIWPTGFLSAAFFLLPLLLHACWMRMHSLPRVPRVLCAGAIGYLIGLTGLFIAYQLYYGNLRAGSDHAALARVSDFALVGAVVGLLLGVIQSRPDAGDPFVPQDLSPVPESRTRVQNDCDWFVVWALAFLAAGMSSFGQGWAGRLAPERLLALLGVPIAVCAAASLGRIGRRVPRVTNAYIAVVIAAGVLSVAAGSLFFQAPVGRTPHTPAFRARHHEIISPSDAELLLQIDSGVVLTAPEFADVVALRPGVSVLGGAGATDLSDVPSADFDGNFTFVWGPNFTRSDFPFPVMLSLWCVDYIYVPDTCSVEYPSRLAPAENSPLTLIGTRGNASLFAVNRAARPAR